MADEKETPAETAAETAETATEAAEEQSVGGAGAAEADEPRAPKPGAEMRLAMKKLEDQLKAVKEENEGHRRRAEEERKAKLTEEQRIKEERDEFQARTQQLERQILEKDIRAKHGIPAAIPLVGTDEAALEAHALEIKKLLPRPKVGSGNQPVSEGNGGPPPTFTRQQIARMSPTEFAKRQDEINQAAREGRVS